MRASVPRYCSGVVTPDNAGLVRWHPRPPGRGYLIFEWLGLTGAAASAFLVAVAVLLGWGTIGLQVAAAILVGLSLLWVLLSVMNLLGDSSIGSPRLLKTLSSLAEWQWIAAGVFAVAMAATGMYALSTAPAGQPGTDGRGHYWLDVHGTPEPVTAEQFRSASGTVTAGFASAAALAFTAATAITESVRRRRTAAQSEH